MQCIQFWPRKEDHALPSFCWKILVHIIALHFSEWYTTGIYKIQLRLNYFWVSFVIVWKYVLEIPQVQIKSNVI